MLLQCLKHPPGGSEIFFDYTSHVALSSRQWDIHVDLHSMNVACENVSILMKQLTPHLHTPFLIIISLSAKPRSQSILSNVADAVNSSSTQHPMPSYTSSYIWAGVEVKHGGQ